MPTALRNEQPVSNVKQLSEDVALSNDLATRPWLALLSILALLCLSLETELLQQVDSFRLYLTTGEIAMEAGVALLLSLAIGCCWWLLVCLAAASAGFLLRNRNKAFRVRVFWSLWIAPPLAYFALELFQDAKLQLFPRWHAGTYVQIWMAFLLSCLFIVGIFCTDWRTVSQFCKTRLVPIAWLHIAAAIVAAIALSVHGVRPFQDYELPATPNESINSPDIYLITIDTLRAEDTSVYGYARPTTPNLEKFARHSFVFDDYFANSNFTTPTTSSIETGKLPWSHRVFHPGGFLRGRNQQETLAALLKRQGYYTAMITSNLWSGPFRHRTLAGYDAVQYAHPKGVTGYRFWRSNLVGLNTQATLALSLLRAGVVLGQYIDNALLGDHYPSPAEDVFNRATGLLDRHDKRQPVFLWTHILPPHDPYWAPDSYRHRFVTDPSQNYAKFIVPDLEKLNPGLSLRELRASYDEMILYADHSAGEFLDWLDRTGRLDRSIVIVSSDHGELFDHDRLYHGGPDLYQGLIHIPLLIHLPGQTHGIRLDQLSEQVDLLPTILDLIGAQTPNWTEGTSLKSALEAPRQVSDRYIFSMALGPDRIFDPITKGTLAVIDNDFKYVRYLESGKEQLFRYKTDTDEEHNLVQSDPEVTQRMRSILLDKLQEVNRRPSPVE